MRKIWLFLVFCVFIFKFLTAQAEVIIIVDKSKKILELKQGKKSVGLYEIGMGLNSSLPKEKKGDFLTPEGMYKILHIKPSEEYKYFLELNYPNINDLALAYYKGMIDKKNFAEWMKKLENYESIEDTPLGSKIGIHGGGAFKLEKKNGKLYKNYHWTKGCIALNNDDLLKLLKYVKPGQKVYILDSQKSLYEMIRKLVYPTKIKPLEIFEGELYLKIDEYTYLNFHLIEHYKGLRELKIQKWFRGALKEEIESDEKGDLLDKEQEEYFKNLIIKNLENVSKPYKELRF